MPTRREVLAASLGLAAASGLSQLQAEQSVEVIEPQNSLAVFVRFPGSPGLHITPEAYERIMAKMVALAHEINRVTGVPAIAIPPGVEVELAELNFDNGGIIGPNGQPIRPAGAGIIAPGLDPILTTRA